MQGIYPPLSSKILHLDVGLRPQCGEFPVFYTTNNKEPFLAWLLNERLHFAANLVPCFGLGVLCGLAV